MDTLRWGILGASKFAGEHMGPALHAAPGGTLAGIATRSPDKLDVFRGIAPDLKVFDRYDALLADPDIDAVYIPLPNHLHAEWTKKALAAGKHVLTEKPVGMNVAEIDELIAARDASGKLAAEAYMIVFHPQWQRVKALIAQGAIGRLMHVDGAFSFNNTDMSNIRNKADSGGGGMRDIGVYVIGAARFVTGQEPSQVHARIRWEEGFDVFSQLVADFPGFTYNTFVSIRMHPRQEMTFHGDEGLIKVLTPFNAGNFGDARIELHQNGTDVHSERFSGARQYELQVAAFNHAASTGTDYACPLEFSRGTQDMIDQVFANALSLPDL